jgi:divalent metal cation (Fe/Co/Zn/Cd) transporter
MNGIYIFLSASFIMTEHIQTFFNTTVFTGITIGLVSLGIGIYYEVFRRKRAKRYTTTMQKTEPSKNDNRSSIRA